MDRSALCPSGVPLSRRALLAGGGLVLAQWAAGRTALAQQAPPATPAGLRVFYSGHSFHMFVPRLVERIAERAGIVGHRTAGVSPIGGSRVIQHWERPPETNTAKPALASGQVDVFTMAAHLMIPDDGITHFTDYGLEHNPKLRLLVQASWFPYDVPTPGKRITDNRQRDEARIEDLQAAVDSWRTLLEKQVDELNQKHGGNPLGITPVGDAVVRLRARVAAGTFPGITQQSALFTDPIGHGRAPIQAITAYTNFATIYRTDPCGLHLTMEGMRDEQHAILEEIAWDVVRAYPYAGVAAKAPAGA